MDGSRTSKWVDLQRDKRLLVCQHACLQVTVLVLGRRLEEVGGPDWSLRGPPNKQRSSLGPWPRLPNGSGMADGEQDSSAASGWDDEAERLQWWQQRGPVVGC